MKALVTEFFGNYTLQDLLGATQALRLAAARLKAEGKTSQDALDKLVGMRDGSDALGATNSHSQLTQNEWRQNGSYGHLQLAHHWEAQRMIVCLHASLPFGSPGSLSCCREPPHERAQ